MRVLLCVSVGFLFFSVCLFEVVCFYLSLIGVCVCVASVLYFDLSLFLFLKAFIVVFCLPRSHIFKRTSTQVSHAHKDSHTKNITTHIHIHVWYSSACTHRAYACGSVYALASVYMCIYACDYVFAHKFLTVCSNVFTCVCLFVGVKFC